MMSRYTGALLHLMSLTLIAITFAAGYYALWAVGAVCFLAMGFLISMAIRLDQVYALPAQPTTVGVLCRELRDGHLLSLDRIAVTRLYVETPSAYVPLYGGFLATINREDAVVLSLEVPK